MGRYLVAHPGASWAVHDVHTGLVAGLKAGGHDVIEYALDGRFLPARVTLEFLWRRQVRHGGPLKDERPSAADVQYHASKDLLERALRHEVDWVLVVCAAYLHPDVLVLCRRAGLRTAAVFTESPYDDAQQAKVAPLVDVCFTNERLSAPLLRAYNARTFYLPVGYDPATHGPGRNGAAPAHDVVFVGSGFESRMALLTAVDWDGIDLGLYGYWDDLPAGHPLHRHLRPGLVDNATAGALYRRARIGLNLYRGTGGAAADSLNPRAYELAADGVFTLSTPRAEVCERFGPNVPTFRTPTELQTLVRHFLRFDQTREQLAETLPKVVTADTYHHRAAELVSRLAKCA
jgi:hypothetical protein